MTEALIDEFYTARNLLYLGAFPQALQALAQITRTANETEKQAIKYRAYLGQGNHRMVINDLGSSTSSMAPALQALYHLATYLQATDEATKEAVGASVEELVGVQNNLVDGTFVAIVSQILVNMQKHEEALKLLAMHPKNLECIALSVVVLLQINRVDMAQKLVARTRGWAEDSPIAQLAEAWTNLYVGGGKYTEASYIFEELAQASSVTTVCLLNSLAVVKMHLGQLPEAEAFLEEALAKESNNPDTLANLVVCANLAAKPLETKNRYLSQLRDVAPNHPFVLDLAAKDAEFDALAAKYAK
ncbi:hypothetical protein LPJ56_000786 [Coemansia sp. RSA 2599]|nr:hypothetical protein LPJ75_000418 [Coemansia sp. RSA 2598]KAJ1828900.1 hypothetical protein LPJ56_000786 [Coemansia sp. RSA 2599]